MKLYDKLKASTPGHEPTIFSLCQLLDEIINSMENPKDQVTRVATQEEFDQAKANLIHHMDDMPTVEDIKKIISDWQPKHND